MRFRHPDFEPLVSSEDREALINSYYERGATELSVSVDEFIEKDDERWVAERLNQERENARQPLISLLLAVLMGIFVAAVISDDPLMVFVTGWAIAIAGPVGYTIWKKVWDWAINRKAQRDD